MSMAIPAQGLSQDEVLRLLEAARNEDQNWRDARMFGLVYRVDDDVIELGKEAYARFQTENGLSPFAFPSIRKFETEVVAMTASLLQGPDCVGNLTSGGTESILMAVKAARDYARERRPGLGVPEVLMPVTAHPAWDKACHYFGLKAVHTPVDAEFKADVAAMRAAMTDNTILMVGSAPTFPHGVIDPIAELGQLAQEKGVLLHVDACVGGFVLPWARKLGYDIPPFDFAVPGVTSMSADIHKYGYAPKGASVVLYRLPELRLHQYFVHTDWPGGIYATPAISGARTGGAAAAAWAVMHYLGEEGYLRLTRTLMQTARRMIEGVRSIAGLTVLGNPQATMFAIAGEINPFALGDAMKRRGWYMENQQLPPALHVTVSPLHERVVDAWLADLEAAAAEARGMGSEDLSEAAAMYGMMGSLPDRKAARDIALQYLDGLYRA